MANRYRVTSLFISTLLCFNTMQAATFTVCRGCEHESIRSAVSAAGPGDTVRVEAGDYREGEIVIDQPMTLVGTAGTIVYGNDSSHVFVLRADSITLKNFTIRDMGISYIHDLSAIKVDKQKYCVIEDNRLHDTFFGIYLKHATDCRISGNEVLGKAKEEVSSGNAIHIWYSDRIEVTGNICREHRDGIYFEFVSESMIRNNVSENNLRYGLHFMFSNHDEYTGNIFRNNGAGVAVMFSRFIRMEGNTFENNWGPSSYGLLLKEIFDGVISGNTFTENTIGIYADGSNRIRIEHNQFTRNGWALKILGSCENDTIVRNNFEGNTFDVITNSASNTNLYTHNYWSEYTGYDLNRDGIGDVPYRPVKLFSYVSSNVPASIILLRSLFVDMVNFAEKVAPSITPETLVDNNPLMEKVRR